MTFRTRWRLMPHTDDVVFSGKGGVFMNQAPLEINVLGFFAKIIRHSSPDYWTNLVSS